MDELSDAASISSLEDNVHRLHKKACDKKPKVKSRKRCKRPKPPLHSDDESIPSVDNVPALGSTQKPAHESLELKAASSAQKAKKTANEMARKVASLRKSNNNLKEGLKNLDRAERLQAKAAKLEAQSAHLTEQSELRLAKQMDQEAANPTEVIAQQAEQLDKEITPMMWGEIRARCQRIADKFCGQVFALEIYAGCCRWSGAVAAAGLNILVPIDRSNGEWADTDNPWLRGCLLMLIELGLIWYVHLATECKLWSKARSTGKAPVPVGPVFFTLQILRAVVRFNQSSKTSEASRWQLNRIHVSIENPWKSDLFSIGEMKDALTELDTIRVKYDCCPYGANYKKPSQLRTTMKALTKLNKLCPHPPGTHEALEGTVTMVEQGRLVTKWKTSLAAQYVPGLCREWADLMCSEAPVQAFTPPGEPALKPHWQTLLMDCTGHTGQLVPQPTCPLTFVCPWDQAVRIWNREKVNGKRAAKVMKRPSNKSRVMKRPSTK